MSEPSSPVHRWTARVKRHPVVASLLVLTSVVVGLSQLGSAARNLAGFLPGEGRPPVDGRWVARVEYPWMGRSVEEAYVLEGSGTALDGSASFLGVPRPIVDGAVDADGVRFTTRTQEMTGEAARPVERRYRGTLEGDTLRLLLEASGPSTPEVRIVAVRTPDSPARTPPD